MRMELRVHQILDGELTEDSFVEFKQELPADHRRAARRIAGLANSARGVEVLWLIGVADDGTVVGTCDPELSSWWPQIQRCFDEVAPDLASIAVARPEGRVLGLFFNTERAPYVLKTAANPELEIPWRDGTRTRSARRHELLRILAPTIAMPQIEVLAASLYFGPDSSVSRRRPEGNDTAVDLKARLRVEFFIDCHSRASFPRHRQVMTLSFPGVPDMNYSFNPTWWVEGVNYGGRSLGTGTAHVDGPRAAHIVGEEYRYIEPEMATQVGSERIVKSRIELRVSGSSAPFVADLELHRADYSRSSASASSRSDRIAYRWELAASSWRGHGE
jgi:hypothetical protein